MAKTKRVGPSPKNEPGFHPAGRYHFEDEHHAIQQFFSFYSLDEARQLLYELYRCWMVSNESAHLDSLGRDRVVFFYEQLGVILEASLRLQQERIAQGAELHCVIEPKIAST